MAIPDFALRWSSFCFSKNRFAATSLFTRSELLSSGNRKVSLITLTSLVHAMNHSLSSVIVFSVTSCTANDMKCRSDASFRRR